MFQFGAGLDGQDGLRGLQPGRARHQGARGGAEEELQHGGERVPPQRPDQQGRAVHRAAPGGGCYVSSCSYKFM